MFATHAHYETHYRHVPFQCGDQSRPFYSHDGLMWLHYSPADVCSCTIEII